VPMKWKSRSAGWLFAAKAWFLTGKQWRLPEKKANRGAYPFLAAVSCFFKRVTGRSYRYELKKSCNSIHLSRLVMPSIRFVKFHPYSSRGQIWSTYWKANVHSFWRVLRIKRFRHLWLWAKETLRQKWRKA
jgi:hypothetical protein